MLRRHGNWSRSLTAFQKSKVTLLLCFLSIVECYSNFARYDGLKHGLRAEKMMRSWYLRAVASSLFLSGGVKEEAFVFRIGMWMIL
ncbi:MAG: hypothetical protein ACKESB_02605 [Candidatus Hodgkinia cicadicola]